MKPDLVSNATSTRIVGEHAYVFEVLSIETEKTFAPGHIVFVMKVLSFERDLVRKGK